MLFDEFFSVDFGKELAKAAYAQARMLEYSATTESVIAG